jgi:hypothetical protein
MKQAFVWLQRIIVIAFAIQSLVVSSAMITRTLTVPFLIPWVTVVAGWITLVLVAIAIVAMLFRGLGR